MGKVNLSLIWNLFGTTCLGLDSLLFDFRIAKAVNLPAHFQTPVELTILSIFIINSIFIFWSCITVDKSNAGNPKKAESPQKVSSSTPLRPNNDCSWMMNARNLSPYSPTDSVMDITPLSPQTPILNSSARHGNMSINSESQLRDLLDRSSVSFNGSALNSTGGGLPSSFLMHSSIGANFTLSQENIKYQIGSMEKESNKSTSSPNVRSPFKNIQNLTPSSDKKAAGERKSFNLTDSSHASSVESRFGVALDSMPVLVSNLRSWIRNSCLQRLVTEIDRTAFKDKGVSQSLSPFFSLNTNHEYIEQRIRKLAGNDMIMDYKWNGGGKYESKGVVKAWESSLPTDETLLFHLLTTYLDQVLPPNPVASLNRPFTSIYVHQNVKPSGKESQESLSGGQSVSLVWTTRDGSGSSGTGSLGGGEPYLTVQTDETILDLPKGNDNLFMGFILFFAYLIRHNNARLGSLSLSTSGLNIQQIFGRRLLK